MFKNLSLKIWLPKTLWGQLVTLLMLALFLSQAVTLAVFIKSRETLSHSFAEEKMISQIAETLNLIEQNTDGKRPSDDLLQSASSQELRFRPGRAVAEKTDDHPQYTQGLKTRILARLMNKQTNITIASQGEMGKIFTSEKMPEDLTISVQVLPEFWVHILRRQPEVSYDWILPLLMTMAMMMIFIILIVSWVVRRLTAPLSALANAAQDLGHGREVKRLDETGARDIRNVTHAFNDMNEKIQRFVGDRTKLLAAISHDLRTPITSLLFRAEFIKDKEMQAKFFETLEEMRLMTEATLNFSNDDNTSEPTKNTDLKSLLETLVNEYIDMDKNVSLEIADTTQQIVLPIRLRSIRRALRNFLDNGIKYGEQVTVSCARNGPGTLAEIYIRDHGAGIDEAELEQVFEPFYRVEKSRNKTTGGVGLGLSISREIVRGHGGDVTLSNIISENEIAGLQVKIVLPLK